MDITDRKLAETALANVNRRMIEAQERERTRIAREPHYDIGQRLTLLAINLAQLEQESAGSPKPSKRVGELKDQASEIAADIHTICTGCTHQNLNL